MYQLTQKQDYSIEQLKDVLKPFDISWSYGVGNQTIELTLSDGEIYLFKDFLRVFFEDVPFNPFPNYTISDIVTFKFAYKPYSISEEHYYPDQEFDVVFYPFSVYQGYQRFFSVADIDVYIDLKLNKIKYQCREIDSFFGYLYNSNFICSLIFKGWFYFYELFNLIDIKVPGFVFDVSDIILDVYYLNAEFDETLKQNLLAFSSTSTEIYVATNLINHYLGSLLFSTVDESSIGTLSSNTQISEFTINDYSFNVLTVGISNSSYYLYIFDDVNTHIDLSRYFDLIRVLSPSHSIEDLIVANLDYLNECCSEMKFTGSDEDMDYTSQLSSIAESLHSIDSKLSTSDENNQSITDVIKSNEGNTNLVQIDEACPPFGRNGWYR